MLLMKIRMKIDDYLRVRQVKTMCIDNRKVGRKGGNLLTLYSTVPSCEGNRS